MAVTALVVPPLMLCVLLALGRYEERVLGGSARPRHASRGRHLRVVPDLPANEPSASSASSETGRHKRGAGPERTGRAA